jgi:type IV secretory pathway VirD2 relaxase
MVDDDMVLEVAAPRSLFADDGPRHLNLVLREVARMGGFRHSRRVYAGRGRGAGAARVLELGERQKFPRGVRVAPRIVRVRGRISAFQQHLRYLQRAGVGRETLYGSLYDGRQDDVDGRSFLERARADRYQFRIVVAVEHGWEYPSLRHLTRRLFCEMQTDLGCGLEWIAADHYNTGLPHTHVVLRGVDDRGEELRLARDYLRAGMRLRASKIVALDLAPPIPEDPRHQLFAEAGKCAPTPLEPRLAALTDTHGSLVLAGRGFDSFNHSLLAARLQTLKSLGLAEEQRGGRWQLLAHLHPTLEALATRVTRLDILDGEVARHTRVRTARQRAIFDPVAAGRGVLVGCVLGQGRGTDGRNFLVVDGHDGRSYFVDLGFLAPLPLPHRAIVAITPSPRAPQSLERTIAAVARAYDGRYSLVHHRAFDPDLAAGEGERHLQRLTALCAQLDLREIGPGVWQLEKDFLANVTRVATAQARLYPVAVKVLSAAPLEQLLTGGAPSWLDHEPVRSLALSGVGFGRSMQDALGHWRGPGTAIKAMEPENAPVLDCGPQQGPAIPPGAPVWPEQVVRHKTLDRNPNDTNFCLVAKRERASAIAR